MTHPEFLIIDDVPRPTTNSLGRPIHVTEEGVRNFWAWFGNSKCVDDEGRPLVFFHGSKGGEINRFTPSCNTGTRQTGDAYGVASYFTTDPFEASTYADGEGSVYPVYARGCLLDLQGQLSAAQRLALNAMAADILLPSDKARFAMGRSRFTTSDKDEAEAFFRNQMENWKAFGDGYERCKPEVVDLPADQPWTIAYTDFDARIEINTPEDGFTLFRAIGFDNFPAANLDGLLMRREGGQQWLVMHRPDYNVKSALGNSGLFSRYRPTLDDHDTPSASPALAHTSNTIQHSDSHMSHIQP